MPRTRTDGSSEASDLAAPLGTSEGLAFAAETLAIHGFYVAEESERQALFQRAMAFAEEAIALDDTAIPQAHLQLSHMRWGATHRPSAPGGRSAKAWRRRCAMRWSATVALDAGPRPRAPEPRLLARRSRPHRRHRCPHALRRLEESAPQEYYERAFALAPDDKAVQTEYATGLMLINTRKNRAAARELLQRAVETPPHDAYERILQEQAVEQLAALDGS